ncbi:MAG TPA: ATP-binding protein, partial [Verrucomicrobiae bacterium]|nr:ATP-binding protein [Verrucomicrobiae bacterium]
GSLDARRVELKAEVLHSYFDAAQPKVVLQDGAIVFTAQLPETVAGGSRSEVSSGSIVRVRGVCAIQWSENHEPGSFRVFISSLDDLVVVRSAPWLTPRHALMLLSGLALGGLLASTWVISLRRRVRAQTEVIRQNQKELLEVSRRAGMAEVATNVLHNVGNVLNSVNVSATIVTEQVKRSAVGSLERAAALVKEREHDLALYVTSDPQGRHLPAFLEKVTVRLRAENQTVLTELQSLRKNVEHINDIVSMQQNFAKAGGLIETISPVELLEDALLINTLGREDAGIEIQRAYASDVGQITVEKHKLLQIVVNLIGNAKHACLESSQPRKQITLRAERAEGKLLVSVLDNGVGIAAENLTRIFNHGFTTRAKGHGFGLHGGALSARELGGKLMVRSEGLGKGALFTLELPLAPVSRASA